MDVNGERREFFKRFKGLRQGDPLSPLINFVGDAFTAMLNLACRRGDLEGLVPHLVEKCLSHLGKSLHNPQKKIKKPDTGQRRENKQEQSNPG